MHPFLCKNREINNVLVTALCKIGLKLVFTGALMLNLPMWSPHNTVSLLYLCSQSLKYEL